MQPKDKQTQYVLRRCYKGVTKTLHSMCNEGVKKALQKHYKSVTRGFQRRYKGVTKTLQKRYKCVTSYYTSKKIAITCKKKYDTDSDGGLANLNDNFTVLFHVTQNSTIMVVTQIIIRLK